MLLDLLLGRPGLRAAGDPLDDRYYGYNWLTGSGGRKTRAGVEVTEDIALTYSAVWCASRLLAEAKGGLPLFTYKRVKSDGREHAVSLPIYDLLHTSPNGMMGSKVFREGRTLHQVNWGNGFAEIEFDRPGDYSSEIAGLHPLHPCRVRPTPESATDRYGQSLYEEFPYQVLNDDKQWVPMRRQEILHVPGALSEDGIWGKGVIAHHREQIGYGMSVHRHGASYFGSGAKPPAVLNLPGMSNKETRRQFRQEWKEVHGTADSVEVVILPMEGKYAPISMSNEDSQFLGCTTPETLITLADGSRKRCDQLAITDYVLGWDAQNQKLIPCAIQAIGDNGVKPLIRITTHRGRVLTTTENHPYWASKRQRCDKCSRRHGPAKHGLPGSWIRADELTVGDYVRVGMRFTNPEPIHVPIDEAWCVGALVGDGCVRSAKYVSFSSTSAGIVSKMQAFGAARGFELKQKSSRPLDWYLVGCAQGERSNESVARAIAKRYGINGKYAHEKTVPDRIMKANDEARAAFLAGLWDTDGTVSKPDAKQPRTALTSTSRELLDGAMHLLASLGIQSAVYDHLPAGKQVIQGRECNVRQGWHLVVCGKSETKRFAEVVGPHMAHEEKSRRVANYATAVLGAREHRDFFEYDRVVKVEELAPGRTIALTVEGTHSHVTNGIISHNTMAFNVGEVARMYMVPVYMLEEYAKASSYNTVEQRGMQFVVFSLMPWIAKDEEQCNLKLLTRRQRQQGYFIEYEVKGLLRGDIKSRYDAYSVGILNGFLTINQICRLENQPTIGPEGDINYLPMNYTTAERMFKGLPSPSEEQAQQEKLAARAGAPKDESQQAFLEWLPRIVEAARGKEPQLSQARTIAAPQICGVSGDAGEPESGNLTTAAVLKCHSDTLERTTEKQGDSREEDGVLARSIAASANVVLEDTLRRLCTKEAKAAERAAKTPDFDKWVAEFYPAHRVLAREMLAPVCEMFRALGVPAYADELADLVCDDSTKALKVFYDTQTPAQLAELLADWPRARSTSYRKWASGLMLASKVEDGTAPQAPVVNITNEINVQPAPVENDITVNVPEQPVPVVNVTNDVKTPDVKVESPVFVDVKVPEPKPKRVTFERDADDQIVEARVEPEE